MTRRMHFACLTVLCVAWRDASLSAFHDAQHWRFDLFVAPGIAPGIALGCGSGVAGGKGSEGFFTFSIVFSRFLRS